MTMKYIVIRAILLACLVPAFLSAQQKIDLWPGYQADQNKEHDNSKPNQGLVDGKPVIRLTDVTQPTITVYMPAKEKANGTAVIVCPGGGYSILAIDLEGTEVCSWLNSIGVTAILLKYRVPKPSLETRYAAPLADAQRALGLVRYNASKWGIDTSHIGIMGFSAGGHLSAAASTNYQKRTYPAIDAADVESCKPNFVMLVYPAYLTVKEEGDKIAAELPVNANTPPTLLIQTEDDPVRVESSVFYYLALKKEKVPAEMHLYTTGGHGYGLRKKGTGILEWPKRAEEWLHTIGMK
jgi:acetyl esterase/lipase